jgi:hypothetical protein
LKTVLIVASDFTPSSYPPALRARFFAQHLPEFGWNPIVLTTDPCNYEWTVDPDNENLLDSSLEIVRTGALPLRWTRRLGFGDIGLRTLWHHWRGLSRICRQRRVDLIFISVPPNAPIVLGRLAHARFGIPYILDYNDPILTDYYWKLPRSKRPPKWALVCAMYRILEPWALKSVDQLVGVADSYMSGLFANYEWLQGTKATPIPFGVEPTDFDYVRKNPRANPVFNRNDGYFHISHVGSGGPGMTNVLRALFQGIQLARQSAPELFSRVRMHFVGTTYASNAEGLYQILPVARECGVEDIVDERPARVHHLDALQILLDSDALAVVGSESPHYTASKIFPYILAAKPLLVILHEESNAVKLLQETCAANAVTFGPGRPLRSIVKDIGTALQELLRLPTDWLAPTNWEKVEPYTARAVTSRLADVLDHTVQSASKQR